MAERDDAALVYRFLRDNGPATALQIVDGCFPVLTAGPPSTIAAVRRRSVGRVFDSVIWMREQGVEVECRPGAVGLGSSFSLIV